MSFAKLRITSDLEKLAVPLEWYRLEEYELLFDLKIESSLYNGCYKFRILFPETYPFNSPKLFCLTKTLHPNIDADERVCLKVLRDGWMPAYNIDSIIVSLICAFYYVSGEDALNTEAADLLEFDLDKFKRELHEAEGR